MPAQITGADTVFLFFVSHGTERILLITLGNVIHAGKKV